MTVGWWSHFVLVLAACVRITAFDPPPTSVQTAYPFNWEDAEFRAVNESCELIRIDIIARHGTRHPFSNFVKSFEELQSKVAQFCTVSTSSCPPAIAGWISPFIHETYGDLTAHGAHELYSFGRVLKNAHVMHSLLQKPYDPAVYRLKSTDYAHTARSATSFAFGLFEGREGLSHCNVVPPYIETAHGSANPIHFHDQLHRSCPDLRPEANEKNMELLMKIVARNLYPVGKRLGREWNVDQHGWNISWSDVNTMGLACAYELAVFNQSTAWCSVLSLDVMEDWDYYQDILAYIQFGYGYPPVVAAASSLMKDIYESLSLVTSSGPLTKVYAQYTHHQEILALISLLKLVPDEGPWPQDGKTVKKREWKLSQICPFAANIVMGLYKCESSKLFVRLFLNGKSQHLPLCSDMEWCPFDEFWKPFTSQLFNATFQNICTEHNGTYVGSSAPPYIAFAKSYSLEQRLQGQIDKSLPSVDVFSRSKCIVLLLCAFILGLVVAVYSMCLGRAILQAKRKEGGAKAMTMR